jgi:hypothetical protein
LLFSAVDLIDDGGRPLSSSSPLHDLFNNPPAGRAAIYHRFFHRGNFINAITGFTETEVMQKQGLCDPQLLQLQDFDLWVRLIKSYDICFLPQHTLSYRIRANGQNLSGPGESRVVRTTNELFFIMRRFFDGVRPEFFRETFHDELLRPECLHPIAIRCEQAFLLGRSPSAAHQLAGIEKLQQLLEDPEGATVLQTEYQFDLPAFSRLLGELAVFKLWPENLSTLFFDVGGGFNEQDACRAMVNLQHRRFDIAFDLRGAPTVQRLRWDPFERRLGRVHVEEIVWRTPEGRQGEVDVSTISANAVRSDGGVYSFETTDPMVLLPFTGPLAHLTVRGWWDIQRLEATWNRFESLLREHEALRSELASRQAELASRQAELVIRDEQLHNILTSRRWRVADKMHSIWRLLRGRRVA